MNELIELVKQWGIDKGITGENGTGSLKGQAKKMREECLETFDAALDLHFSHLAGDWEPNPDTVEELKDGIGDTCVTLILLAEMSGWSLEECLQHAYDEIKGRTGVMSGGTFVKDK